jgi:hypothetical protein
MAAKPENLARTSINKHIPMDIHREKMGSPFSAGTADQWYSGDPHDLWIEYKFLPKPPSRAFTLSLSKLQELWLDGRYNEGRAVGVILCFPAKYGCWMFYNSEWKGKIDPSVQTFYTRKEVAAFITRSCIDDSYHSALIRRRKGGASVVPDRDLLDRYLLHSKRNQK